MTKLEMLKLHYQRKEKLSKQFSVTKRQIQEDTDKLIEYIKTTGIELFGSAQFLEFINANPETFFHKLLDWTATDEYRIGQIKYIVGSMSVLISSNNEFVLIQPAAEA